tara:strand:+ start:3911 stop:4120 length:210 start_codon:yes stop_codon:yes gene_type:complete
MSEDSGTSKEAITDPDLDTLDFNEEKYEFIEARASQLLRQVLWLLQRVRSLEKIKKDMEEENIWTHGKK